MVYDGDSQAPPDLPLLIDWNEGGKLLADVEDLESESPSFKELNKTIFYAVS